ncbi:hypothetical protein EDD22DRAFT_783882, partial [Suillus occidentalis]
ENLQQFKSALNDAWNNLDETVKTIASSHHKSFRRVENDLCSGHGLMKFKCTKLNTWNTFCWKKRQENNENGATGKDVLQELVKDHHVEYQALTEDEKAELLLEYSKYKETRATGIHISTKSKVSNVTQTLKAVENELNNLRCRTGTETILYATCGSTDLPLHGVTFTTEGVDEFMSSVMNIDNQDLISKMEGFAIQGMKGTMKNHQKQCSKVHSEICHEIGKGLVEITKDEDAKMHWTHYFRNVIQCYQVIIEGWPTGIPFVNLSKVLSTLPELESLLQKWRAGTIRWRQVDDEEFQQLLDKRNVKLENGELIEHHCHTHSDKGRKHTWSTDRSGESTRRKKTHKSAETVNTDDEDKDLTTSTANTNTRNNMNISGEGASTNTNISADNTNSGANINSNAHANLGTSSNITNPGAFSNVNNGAYNFNPLPSPTGDTALTTESFDPDFMLDNLEHLLELAAALMPAQF